LVSTVTTTDITTVHNCWPSPAIFGRRPYFHHGFFPDPYGRVHHYGYDSMHHGPGDHPKGAGPHILKSFPVKLPPGTGLKAPDWPPKGVKTKPGTLTAKLDGGKRALGLPATATTGSSLKKQGQGALGAKQQPGPGEVKASKGSGAQGAGGDRRALLAQERAKMEGHRKQMQQAKTGGSPAAAPEEKPGLNKITDSKPIRKTTLPTAAEPRSTPKALGTASGTAKTTPKTRPSTVTPPQAKGTTPVSVTPEQLKQQREAKEKERIQNLQKTQQATGVASGGQPARPAGSGGASGAGMGKGSDSPKTPGAIRPPRGSGSSVAGGPGSAAAGGGGIRSPKPGSGAGVKTQPVRPPTPPKGGGGGGGGKAQPQKPEQKKEQKKQ